MSFHWNCFIVPSRLEIRSFIAMLVCLSLFYSVYVQYIEIRSFIAMLVCLSLFYSVYVQYIYIY